ncbi:MAG: hypothetical protein ACLVJH_01500 [Faecalibacterium prausnitzii]
MNKSTWESTVKPVVVLSVIALVRQPPAGPGQLLYCAYHRREPEGRHPGSLRGRDAHRF